MFYQNCFIGVSALGCKATVNALTHCTGVATDNIDLELKLYLTGELATGGLCSSKHILMEKSLVKLNVDIKLDPTQ